MILTPDWLLVICERYLCDMQVAVAMVATTKACGTQATVVVLAMVVVWDMAEAMAARPVTAEGTTTAAISKRQADMVRPVHTASSTAVVVCILLMGSEFIIQ